MSVAVSLRLDIDPMVRALTYRAMHALYAADLDEAADEVSNRLLGVERLIVLEPSGDGKAGSIAARLRLSPFAELVLWEALGIVKSTADSATQVSRVRQALTLAGY